MKNRPDKPGLYWWEDVHGYYHTVDFDSVMEAPIVGDDAYLQYGSVDDFEEMGNFDHWIGQAHPPKKVDRYRVFSEEITGRNYWGDHYSNGHRVSYRKDNAGTWVRYDDVKEFLLGDENNG